MPSFKPYPPIQPQETAYHKPSRSVSTGRQAEKTNWHVKGLYRIGTNQPQYGLPAPKHPQSVQRLKLLIDEMRQTLGYRIWKWLDNLSPG